MEDDCRAAVMEWFAKRFGTNGVAALAELEKLLEEHEHGIWPDNALDGG